MLLNQENQTNKQLSELEIQNQKRDPYLQLGVGLYLYRSYLRTMTVLFLILSILACPIAYIYSEGMAFSDIKENSYHKAVFSLGNMGYTTPSCIFQPLNLLPLELKCDYGYMSEIAVDGIGIDINKNPKRDACLVKEEFENVRCSNLLKKDGVI